MDVEYSNKLPISSYNEHTVSPTLSSSSPISDKNEKGNSVRGMDYHHSDDDEVFMPYPISPTRKEIEEWNQFLENRQLWETIRENSNIENDYTNDNDEKMVYVPVNKEDYNNYSSTTTNDFLDSNIIQMDDHDDDVSILTDVDNDDVMDTASISREIFWNNISTERKQGNEEGGSDVQQGHSNNLVVIQRESSSYYLDYRDMFSGSIVSMDSC